MGVSWNDATQQPWVFLIKMTILGCFGGTTIFGNIQVFFRSCAAVSLSLARSLVLSRYIPMHLPIQNYSIDLSTYFPGTDIPMYLWTYLPLPLYHSIFFCFFFRIYLWNTYRKDGRLMPNNLCKKWSTKPWNCNCYVFFASIVYQAQKKIINTMRIGFSSGSPMKLNFEKVGVALQQEWIDIDHHWYWLNSNIDGSMDHRINMINASLDHYIFVYPYFLTKSNH